MTLEIKKFVDFLSLVYCEARNVRHLVDSNMLLRAPYKRLIDLPRNRDEAWASIQSLRQIASKASSAKEAEEIFAKKFQLTLIELIQLFKHFGWKDSARGGNKWAHISEKVMQLCTAIDSKETDESSELLAMIPTMSHNTGILGKKLYDLDNTLRAIGRELS